MINSAVTFKMRSVSSLVGDWMKMRAEEREELSTSVRMKGASGGRYINNG